DKRGLRELRSPAEPSVGSVEHRSQRVRGVIEQLPLDRLRGRLQPIAYGQRAADRVALTADLLATVLPRLRDTVEHHPPGRQPMTRFRREVGARVKRN